MADSIIKELMMRGEEFFNRLANALLANPLFLDALKKAVAAKEAVDGQVAVALKKVNVATRKDLAKLERRLAEVEAELAALKEKEAEPPKPKARRKAAPKA
jgi:polyhydroxyalkanoate synthesis regulator phasin